MVLRWAPNGKEVLAGGVHEAELGLWSYDVEQGKAWQLFPSPAVIGIVSPDGSRIAIDIRDWYGGTWLAKLERADSVHASVPSALTEEQYLRRSCGEYAEAIRRGTYRRDAEAHLGGFLTRLRALAESYYQREQLEDALDTFRGLEELCAALNRQPAIPAMAVAAKAFQRRGRPQEAEATLERLRRLVAANGDVIQRTVLWATEKTLAGETTEVGNLWQCLEDQRIDEAARQLLNASGIGDLGRVRREAAEAFYQRGKVRKHNGGGYGAAIDDYTMALRLNPGHRRARCDLAWLQVACPVAELRDGKQAVTNATLACEQTGWKDHQCLGALAAVCAQVGDFPAAVSRQRQALESLTDHDASVWRGDYESRLHRYEAARPYEQGDLWSFTTGRLLGWWRFDQNSGIRRW